MSAHPIPAAKAVDTMSLVSTGAAACYKGSHRMMRR
jgi:hypothetical protein